MLMLIMVNSNDLKSEKFNDQAIDERDFSDLAGFCLLWLIFDYVSNPSYGLNDFQIEGFFYFSS